MPAADFDRIGLVVHPRRELGDALATVRAWAERRHAELVQVASPGQGQQVAPRGDAAGCDLVIALGGDGTALAALHAAAPGETPVLGVACGSLGALTAVSADRLEAALDRVAAGEWSARVLPALRVAGGGPDRMAVNDLVLVRAGAGQVMLAVDLDGEPFIRFAGDGLICATPLGSTAYTLAVGGPMLAPGTAGLVLTPLAPHGGAVTPLVTTPESRLDVLLDPGHSGARLEIDGRVAAELAPLHEVRLELGWVEAYATLISLGEQESIVAGLRRRRILLDSPRMLARDDREAARTTP